MLSTYLVPLLVVFVSAIVIHLGTRLFLGPRADGLPGGAIAAAFVQSMPLVRVQDTQTAILFAAAMVAVALLGHYLSQRVVSRRFPRFGRKT